MIDSRDLNELLPVVKEKMQLFLDKCKEDEIPLIVTSTYRDNECQNALYSRGRTTPGKKVTDAKAGYSFHNFRCAMDIVPVINGKPIWDDHDLWEKIGTIAESCGLEWAGRWTTFKELCHVQYTNGRTLEQLRNGESIS